MRQEKLIKYKLADKVRESTLLTDVMGSDHCPVYLELDMMLPVTKKRCILRIYPSEDAISRFMTSMKDTVENYTGSQQGLIDKLNRKINGWTTYHKGQNTKQYWHRTGFMNISQAWIENGYEIMHLHLDKKYIVFRQTEKKLASVDIPEVFLNSRVPEAAKHELETFFDYIIGKYGL